MKNFLIKSACVLLFVITLLTSIFSLFSVLTFPKEITYKVMIVSLLISVVNAIQVYFVFKKCK